MAALAVDATALLVDLVDDYVRALHRPDGRVRMSDPVQRIRGLESQCDELRTHVVERAFATAPEATALTCRHLVTALDAVTDAVEDVTDHLLYASGGRAWIDRPDGPADG